MDDKTKLILALLQINNLTELLADNEWETYLYSRLVSLRVEVQRQLSLL